MRHTWKRLISFGMVLCLLAVLLPLGVFAADGLTPEDFHVDKSGAAEDLKAGLAAHETEITVLYRSFMPMDDEDAIDIFYEALAVDTDDGYTGDYLLYSVVSVDIDIEYTVQDVHYYNKVVYKVTYVSTPEQEQAFRADMEQTLEELTLDAHNDYQRAKAIYDYMTANISLSAAQPDDSDYRLLCSAYGAYTQGQATPKGFAALFYAMALQSGMYARVISGTKSGSPYGWNILQIYDNWYLLDAAGDCFLKGTADYAEPVRDSYYDTASFHRLYALSEASFDPAAVGSGTLENGLSWEYNAATATLTISGSGPMQDFAPVTDKAGLTSVPRPWTAYVAEGAHYVVAEGVTSIGAYAFSDVFFENITIASTVQTMGSYAFSGSRGEEITLPEGITHIPDHAFAGSWVFRLGIPESVTHIGDAAFVGCMRLVELMLPAGLLSIGDGVCADCYSLLSAEFGGDRHAWMAIDMGTGNEQLCNLVENSGNMDFFDVSPTDWYYEPVMWAVSEGVAGGVGGGMFLPAGDCTRAQVVTMLWAANGRPEPETTENSFTDVADDAWYAQAVLWAVENGITGGVGDGVFAPDNSCSRAQIVTFLYAAAGRPQVENSSVQFEDVSAEHWYAAPVQWAAENGITGGVGDGLFGAEQICTRGQVVTFLNKAYAGE